MFDFILIFKTLIVLTLAVISPGPDFFMVLRNSLVYGRHAGLFSALGIATGCLISFTLLIGGLKFLLTYKMIQILLSLVCGLYLVYLGYMNINNKSKQHHMSFTHQNSKAMFVYFRNGLFTNIFNPKLYTISGAILTYTEQQNPSLATNITIVIGNALIVLIWFSAVCFLLSHPKMQKMYFKQEVLIHIILGCVLIMVGGQVIVSQIL